MGLGRRSGAGLLARPSPRGCRAPAPRRPCRRSRTGVGSWAPGARGSPSSSSRARPPREERREGLGGGGPRFHVLVTSYEHCSTERAALRRQPWSSLIVDEGHRLKGGAAGRLFQELAQLDAEHRVLLTGTPLQNNLDELHHLLDFLDPAMLAATVAAVTHKRVADAPAGLASVVLGARELEQRRRADDDESADARLARLTAALRGRMLRRTKADVLRAALPGKRELVVRVELSAPQKALYRAVLTKNYDALAAEDRGRGGGAPPNLQNVVIQLRRVCDHCELMYDHFPDVCDGLAARADPALPPRLGALLAGGGKLALLDAMLLKLRARGHRVLVFSQMTKMLDVLGEYCALRSFAYERLDGDTAARDRARRIDRFNAAAADAPLPALARAHRLGQTDRVLVYRLVCRATVEERILEVAKRKLLLEHVVVERGGARGGQSRDDLNDVLRYGAEELFAAGDGDGVHRLGRPRQRSPGGGHERRRWRATAAAAAAAAARGAGLVQGRGVAFERAPAPAALGPAAAAPTAPPAPDAAPAAGARARAFAWRALPRRPRRGSARANLRGDGPGQARATRPSPRAPRPGVASAAAAAAAAAADATTTTTSTSARAGRAAGQQRLAKVARKMELFGLPGA
ncbi:CHD3-type chromatin-remodeling factor [Aureococcus anophagefferens]|nr:CHD3-type chromatin-remodeling factor [Aureococcus anophagefferens]